MIKHIFKIKITGLLALTSVIIALLHVYPSGASGRVIMYDAIALQHQKVILKATTMGKIFKTGGKLVEFMVEGKSLGKTLSGFDGLAFKSFRPEKAGLFQIRAKFNGDEDTGILLSAKAGTALVFVDVWSGLLENLITRTPKTGSQQALEEISKIHPIIYLQTGLFSIHRFKIWLRDHNFPTFPVIPWAGGNIFQEITQKKMKVHAVIGGPEVIATVKKEKWLLFSFDPKAGAQTVTKWPEITDKITHKTDKPKSNRSDCSQQ